MEEFTPSRQQVVATLSSPADIVRYHIGHARRSVGAAISAARIRACARPEAQATAIFIVVD